MSEQTQAYIDGSNAYYDQQGAIANPHDSFTFEWVEWNAGWHDAMRDCQKDREVNDE